MELIEVIDFATFVSKSVFTRDIFIENIKRKFACLAKAV